MLKYCGNQVRLGMGGPVGLDFGGIILMAQAQQIDVEMLSEVLPAVEQAILRGLDDDGGDDSVESDD